MSILEIAEFRLSDVAEIARLDRDIFPDFWTEEMWQSECSRTDFFGFVAKRQGEIAGYICGTALFEEGELPKVAVRKEFRGAGLGGKLVDRLLLCMKERSVEKVFLEVRVSNAAALGLYRSKGFQVTRERKRYYPDGEDAVEMVKALL